MPDYNNIINPETTYDLFEQNDFVFTKEAGGSVIGGGYKINSMFLQEDISPMITLNNDSQTGGKVSSPFENLAVPAGLFYVNMRVPKKYVDRNSEEHYKSHETISDDMIDKLYALVEVDKKRKRKTRKHNKPDKTKTRRLK
jgi:hypothetical protein